ncbi:MAG TPA: Gfo/Idh/MocA family oxidoreductase [Gaiellaceae bacterium]|nr:Gfo/Idh/MocA family oxidoreductase [Gaiellaceae bacterium]
MRLAVVGLGYWGPNLVRVLNELPEADLKVICDLDRGALEKAAVRYPGLRATDRYEDILEDDEIDAVVVATPVSTHEEIVAAAVAADKHVFVEKSLTESSLTARRLIDEAARRNVVLMPGHTFLYSPPVLMIGDLIHTGQLGDIYFVTSSRVNLGMHQPDVSVTWDLGPHDFSILCYWLGELPTSVVAVSRGCIVPTLPDVAFISLGFPSGTIAHVELSWLAPSKLRRTAVVGSEKMVVYDDTSNEPVRVFDSGATPPSPQTFGEFKMSYRSGDVVSPRIDAAEPLVHEMLDFCEAIRTGTEPRSSSTIGLEVIQICEAVDASLETGGPVQITPSVAVGDASQ